MNFRENQSGLKTSELEIGLVSGRIDVRQPNFTAAESGPTLEMGEVGGYRFGRKSRGIEVHDFQSHTPSPRGQRYKWRRLHTAAELTKELEELEGKRAARNPTIEHGTAIKYPSLSFSADGRPRRERRGLFEEKIRASLAAEGFLKELNNRGLKAHGAQCLSRNLFGPRGQTNLVTLIEQSQTDIDQRGRVAIKAGHKRHTTIVRALAQKSKITHVLKSFERTMTPESRRAIA
jgi:hypothetical protein